MRSWQCAVRVQSKLLCTAYCQLRTVDYLRLVKLFTIPNIITLGNLGCGCLAIVCAFNGDLVWSAYLVGIAAVLDFLDGFVARALKQHSPIGKELDSLADMVSFGLVPAVVMFHLMRLAFSMHEGGLVVAGELSQKLLAEPVAFAAFLIALFSALRLAKFNIDTRQSDSFIGVPTPANSILICSFPLILNSVFIGGNATNSLVNGWATANPNQTTIGLITEHDITLQTSDAAGSFSIMMGHLILNPAFLLAVTFIMSILLISEIPLFALKFKSFKWKGNELRFSFLAMSVLMMVLLKYLALPLVIVLYILLSVVNNLVTKKKAA